MSVKLNEIEKRLESLIEDHLVKYLPGPFWQVRLAHRLTEALKANLATQGLETSLADKFEIVVHPSTLSQWEKDARLMEGLTKIFRLATDEAGLHFDNAPTLTLLADPNISVEDLEVRVEQPEKMAATQNTAGETPAAEEFPVSRTAFLIIGGTKVHTLQQVVTNVGRRLDNHVIVDDPRVSRYHAQIRYSRGRFIIFDLNSTGGTYVNGQRTTQSVLYPGDVISLAGLPIIFGQDNPPPSMGHTGDTAPFSASSSERSTAVLKTTPRSDTTTP